MKSRGYIQNKDTIQQLPEYNLRYTVKNHSEYGVQSPTDVDLVFELHGKVIIFVEFKKQGYGMPKGQELTLTRMVNALQGNHTKKGLYQGKDRYQGAYLIVAEHNTDKRTKFFDGANCNVTKFYDKWNKWTHRPKNEHLPLHKVVENIFRHHGFELEEYKQEQFFSL